MTHIVDQYWRLMDEVAAFDDLRLQHLRERMTFRLRPRNIRNTAKFNRIPVVNSSATFDQERQAKTSRVTKAPAAPSALKNVLRG
jgi:hypothetical protein